MQTQTLTRTTEVSGENQLAKTLVPLAIDVAIPLSSYYLMRDGFGLSLVMSLALSSVFPAARSVIEFARSRRFEALAMLMVAVNVAGIIVNFTTGDARLMMAKDSAISSVIGIGILISVWRGQPVMSAGLKPFLTKGVPARIAAFETLSASSRRFRGLAGRYSMIWGFALLSDCIARLFGALMLPVHTMVWASTVMILVAIAAAVVVSGGAAADPMEKMISATTAEAN